MLRKLAYALSLSVLWATSSRAQDWAAKMFEMNVHDFGSVAHGAKAQFDFVLSNLYVEDVHIAERQPQLRLYDCHVRYGDVENL